MRVQMTETLIWYDGPQLAVAELDTGQRALMIYVDDEVHPTEINARTREPQIIPVYMVVPASARRIRNVLAGNTTLRQAFKFPEHGEAYLCRVEGPGPWDLLEPLPKPYPDSMLSGKGCRLTDF